MKPKVLAFSIVASVVAHAILYGWAAALYPGGTWFDRHVIGYDPWTNFLCDLLHDPSLNGQPNPGAAIAKISFFVLLPGFLCLWPALARLVSGRRRLGRAIRWSGLVSVIGTVGVVLAPSDRFWLLHGIAVVAAAGSGISAAALGIAASWYAPGRKSAVFRIGLTALVLAGVNLSLYVHHKFLGARLSEALPVLQKPAALAVLGWMIAVALAVARSGRTGASSPGGREA